VATTEEKHAQEKHDRDARDPEVRVVDRRWWARGETVVADESGARKPTYIEELEQRLADANGQLQRVMAEHRRSLEEFEQVKARLRRDVGREVERGKRAVLADLLDVLDNLDRAIGSAAPGESPNLKRGVELVRDQFLQKLDALGVVRMPAVGQRFDALRHEAVSTAPVTDPSQDGVIVAVMKEGYAIGDELLRPASVVVGALTSS
jgi:molecular chaperone GrpE